MEKTNIDEKPRCIFRADGNSKIGLGHLSRSLALARMLQDDFRCVFVYQEAPTSWEKLVYANGLSLQKLPKEVMHEEESAYLTNQFDASHDILCLDGYAFTSSYQKKIKERGWSLVSIDDIHHCHYFSDVVINHAPGISKDDYSMAPYTKLYTGLNYALLAPEFLALPAKGLHQDPLAYLICFGGADPHNYTLKTLRHALNNIPNGVFHVITGDAYAHYKSLAAFQAQHAENPVIFHSNMTSEELADLMRRSQTMLCSASTIALEYMAIGGRLFIEETVENQKHMYKHLLAIQGAEPLHFLLSSHKTFKRFVAKQRQRIDCKSPKRLRKIFSLLS